MMNITLFNLLVQLFFLQVGVCVGVRMNNLLLHFFFYNSTIFKISYRPKTFQTTEDLDGKK